MRENSVIIIKKLENIKYRLVKLNQNSVYHFLGFHFVSHIYRQKWNSHNNFPLFLSGHRGRPQFSIYAVL